MRVPTQPSDMSFGVSDGRDFEYNGASPNGLFANRAHLLAPWFHRRRGRDQRPRAQRFAVRRHAFRHRIALAYFDLEAPPAGGRLVRFEPSDHLTADAVRALTGTPADSRVRLLAALRSFGHCFNPIALYYCSAGQTGWSGSWPR
jgi:hypothetical protein